MKNLLLVLVGAMVVLMIGVSYLFWTGKAITKEMADEPTPTIVMNVEVTPTLTLAVNHYPGTSEFRSVQLKIAFNYLPVSNEMGIKTMESGNMVYVYAETTKPETGQSVEVFEKPVAQSLEEAIKEQFLAGKAEKDCWVVDSTEQHGGYPDSYRLAEITFPKPTGSDEPWWGLGSACSADYAQTNGSRYFLEDTSHPERFVFVNIGQYAILAGETVTWQETLRFLD